MSPTSPRHDGLEARARRRVQRKLGWYAHALVFTLVNLAFIVWAHTTGGGPGFVWGWGLGLLLHGVFVLGSLRGEGLRERMLRQEIERLHREDAERR